MAMELIEDLEITILNTAQTANTTTITSSAIDIANFDGFILIGGFGTAAADNLAKLQACDTSGGTYADVSGATGLCDGSTAHFVISCHKPRQRYHKAVQARGTSSTTHPLILIKYSNRLKAQAHAVANSIAYAAVVDKAGG